MANRYTSPWSEKSNTELLDLYGQFKTNEYIAKKLNKTTTAVQRQLERLESSNKHLQTGTISASELASHLNVDPTTVIRHINKKGLPARKFYKSGKIDENANNHSYYIHADHFWEWATENKDLYNWSKIERRVLNPEPEWLEEQVILDKEKIPSNSNKPWTPTDDERLWNLYYKENMLQKNIAIVMNRSRNGIKRRLERIREKKFINA